MNDFCQFGKCTVHSLHHYALALFYAIKEVFYRALTQDIDYTVLIDVFIEIYLSDPLVCHPFHILSCELFFASLHNLDCNPFLFIIFVPPIKDFSVRAYPYSWVFVKLVLAYLLDATWFEVLEWRPQFQDLIFYFLNCLLDRIYQSALITLLVFTVWHHLWQFFMICWNLYFLFRQTNQFYLYQKTFL